MIPLKQVDIGTVHNGNKELNHLRVFDATVDIVPAENVKGIVLNTTKEIKRRG